MSEQNEASMTFDNRAEQDQKYASPTDELDWLMSLALDDALAADETARLDSLLQQAPEFEARWEQWQMVDRDFRVVPAALPPDDFMEKFALRLEIQERQRRLRTGFIFGAAAVALWGSALVGVFMLGALLWSNQGVWFGEFFQNITYLWAAMGQFARALVSTAEALWAAPQARTVLACYLVTSVAIIGGWLFLLRRSTRELPLGDAQLVEA